MPDPAFRGFWKVIFSYKWSASQRINILEITAFLAEFRRQVRDWDDWEALFQTFHVLAIGQHEHSFTKST